MLSRFDYFLFEKHSIKKMWGKRQDSEEYQIIVCILSLPYQNVNLDELRTPLATSLDISF